MKTCLLVALCLVGCGAADTTAADAGPDAAPAIPDASPFQSWPGSYSVLTMLIGMQGIGPHPQSAPPFTDCNHVSINVTNGCRATFSDFTPDGMGTSILAHCTASGNVLSFTDAAGMPLMNFDGSYLYPFSTSSVAPLTGGTIDVTIMFGADQYETYRMTLTRL